MNSIVVADENWNIGRNGGLLVHLSGDLRYFKQRTWGKTIIYGRKTLESFPGTKPLPGRRNIVLTKNPDYRPAGCEVCHSREEVLALVGADTENVFIAGGETVYRQFIDDCDAFYVTKIYRSFPADRAFPDLDQRRDLTVVWRSELQEEEGIVYQFLLYRRQKRQKGQDAWRT